MNQHLLEITITAGPTAGQRVRVNQSPATFGRGMDNPIVVDMPTVSRVHGELRFEDDRWVVANLSKNGTQLNRRAIGRKPRGLQDGDQIVVGNQPVMTVALREGDGTGPTMTDASGGESGDVGTANALPPKPGMSPRTKLWLAIAGFWVAIFGLAFFLSTGADSGDAQVGPAIPVLSDREIAVAIRAPLPRQEASPRTAGQHFDEAEAFYGMVNADPQNAFRAFFAYKTALSYAFGDDFTDDRDDWGGKPAVELAIAQKRYTELESQLIADVQRLYKDAHGKLVDRRYREARLGFEKVFRLYNDPQNVIYKNALQQRDLARQRQAAR
ncbi:MAG: FHA domain-containing protein [Planctomycetota bacterium]